MWRPFLPSSGSPQPARSFNLCTKLLTKADSAQAESLWSRLKTEVLERRGWPVFADLADAQASIADYLTTIITTAYTPASVIKPRITLINNYFKPLP